MVELTYHGGLLLYWIQLSSDGRSPSLAQTYVSTKSKTKKQIYDYSF